MKAKKLLSVLLSLVLVMGLFPAGIARAEQFNDTGDTPWATGAIERWSDFGVVTGMGDGSFNPTGTMTRAQAAQVFTNLLNLKSTAGAQAFTDVAPGAWYADAIAKVTAAGIMNGMGDGTMLPDAPVTREQFFVMFARAMGIPEQATTSGVAADGSTWSAGYINALTDRGFVQGDGTGVNALANINRASVMSLLDQTITTYANVPGQTVSAQSSGVTLVVANNVTVTGTADTVVAAAESGSVTLDGVSAKNVTVVADTDVAFTGTSSADSVSVTAKADGANVTVGASTTVGNITSAANNSTITNDGTVTGDVSTSGSNSGVKNNGTVSGDVSTSGASSTVTNSGTVGGDVSTSGRGSAVTNSGTVSGDVSTSGSNSGVTNSGSVGGNVSTSGSSSGVNNSGTVSGTVSATGGSGASGGSTSGSASSGGSYGGSGYGGGGSTSGGGSSTGGGTGDGTGGGDGDGDEEDDTPTGEQITITYNPNGGVGDVTPKKVGKDTETSLETADSLGFKGLNNKNLLHWNTLANDTGTSYAAGSKQTFTEDVTLYAIWANTVTVTLHYNDNDSTVETLVLKSDETLTQPDTRGKAPTRENYDFALVGWYLDPGFGGSPYTFGSTVAGDIELYAKWERSFTVTFHLQLPVGKEASNVTGLVGEGSGDTERTLKVTTEHYTKADAPVLSLDDYTFAGWATAANGEVAESFTFPQADGNNLYAVWLADSAAFTFAQKSYEVTSGAAFAELTFNSSISLTSSEGATVNVYLDNNNKPGAKTDDWTGELVPQTPPDPASYTGIQLEKSGGTIDEGATLWISITETEANGVKYAESAPQKVTITVKPSGTDYITIKVGTIANGDIIPENYYPVAGTDATLTLNLYPDEGYQFETVKAEWSPGGSKEEPVENTSGIDKTASISLNTITNGTEVTITGTTAKIDYAVNFTAALDHGSVAVKKGSGPDLNTGDKANAGDTITITLTPDSNYELDTLRVTYGEDNEVETSGADNVYTFTMPAGNVTIAVTFKDRAYTVTFDDGSRVGGTVSADPTSGKVNTLVTVTATPGSGYVLTSLTGTYGQGNTALRWKDPVPPTGDGTGAVSASNQYTFEMPAGDVTLSAQFAKPQYAVTVTGGAKLQEPTGDTAAYTDTIEKSTTAVTYTAKVLANSTENAEMTAKVSWTATVNGTKYDKTAIGGITITTPVDEAKNVVTVTAAAGAVETTATVLLTATYEDENGMWGATVTVTVQPNIEAVTFDPNGGTWPSDNLPDGYDEASKKVIVKLDTDGKIAALPAAPTKDGSIFLGWYNGDDVKITAENLGTLTFADDDTITAKWQAIAVIVPEANGNLGEEYTDALGRYAIKAQEGAPFATYDLTGVSFYAQKRSMDSGADDDNSGNFVYLSIRLPAALANLAGSGTHTLKLTSTKASINGDTSPVTATLKDAFGDKGDEVYKAALKPEAGDGSVVITIYEAGKEDITLAQATVKWTAVAGTFGTAVNENVATNLTLISAPVTGTDKYADFNPMSKGNGTIGTTNQTFAETPSAYAIYGDTKAVKMYFSGQYNELTGAVPGYTSDENAQAAYYWAIQGTLSTAANTGAQTTSGLAVLVDLNPDDPDHASRTRYFSVNWLFDGGMYNIVKLVNETTKNFNGRCLEIYWDVDVDPETNEAFQTGGVEGLPTTVTNSEAYKKGPDITYHFNLEGVEMGSGDSGD